MRVNDYPVPDYACYVWDRGDGLCLQLSDGRTIHLPNSKLGADGQGWSLLRETLAARRVAAQSAHTIGTSAEPTKAMCEAYLLSAKKLKAATETDVDIFAEESN